MLHFSVPLCNIYVLTTAPPAASCQLPRCEARRTRQEDPSVPLDGVDWLRWHGSTRLYGIRRRPFSGFEDRRPCLRLGGDGKCEN